MPHVDAAAPSLEDARGKRGKLFPRENLIIVLEVAFLCAHFASYVTVSQTFHIVAQNVNQNPNMMQKVT